MRSTRLATAVAIDDRSDRRRYPRTAVNRPARIRVDGAPHAAAQLMNISTRGAALFYSAPLDRGTPVWLRVNLPTHPQRVKLEIMGVVRQSHLLGESHLIRVAFTNPPLHAVSAILEFIKTRGQADE